MIMAEAANYLILGIFIGLLYLKQSRLLPNAPYDRLSAVFLALTLLAFTPSYTALVVWDVERQLLRRETASNSYTRWVMPVCSRCCCLELLCSCCAVLKPGDARTGIIDSRGLHSVLVGGNGPRICAVADKCSRLTSCFSRSQLRYHALFICLRLCCNTPRHARGCLAPHAVCCCRGAFFIAKSLTTAPMEIVQVAVYAVVIYFLIGFQYDAAKFFIWLITLLLFALTSETLGYICAIVTPDSKVGIVLLTLIMMIVMSFSGYLVSVSMRCH